MARGKLATMECKKSRRKGDERREEKQRRAETDNDVTTILE